MKTNPLSRLPKAPPYPPRGLATLWLLLLLVCGTACQLAAATATIYSEDFEAAPTTAVNLDDTSDADPTQPGMVIVDDNPVGGVNGSGVQVVDWQVHGGSKALLLRANSEAQVNLKAARSGSRYQLDFWLFVAKGSGDRNFYLILRGEGSDFNGDDYLAYRSDRAASPSIWYYDGVGPGAAAWANTGGSHSEGAWQHHRIVIDPNALTFDLYVDNMDTPLLAGAELSRCEVAVPTLLRIVHEGNSADDGYFIIDDLTLTVEGSRDLATTFTEGFEGYAARATADDDADPAGPWITTEVDGTGSGKERLPAKVQVVGPDVVPPHSGSKCLKLELGQRAGASFAWGVPPLSDVQITWWARVPASEAGATANYLRMSLYGSENGSALAGDNALLGYGSRQPGLGDETSLTYYVTAWVDSGVDYTPDTWEEYRLITHVAQGRYTIIKNPSSASPEVIVDRGPMIGSATDWAPVFMAAWSSSNGAGHPPVFVDDIEIKSIVSNPDPLPEPYTVRFEGSHFTNVTVLKLSGPVGGVAVDPRDHTTILFTMDVGGGGIFRANKTASGTWLAEPQPIVSGLDRPSGLAISQDGTIWWTHDYTMALMRLKWPWSSNAPERVIADFGDPAAATVDDDPIDVTVAPATFTGALGKPGMIIVADRGNDGDANNALFYVDPATSALDQTGYSNFLVSPTTSGLGTANLNAITPLPQFGEVVALSQDGFITAVNGDGVTRNIWPPTLWSDLSGPSPAGAAIAADPLTGRLWIADDLLDEVWSVSADPNNPSADQKEFSFPLTNPLRSQEQIDFHDPGLTFSPSGAFLVVSDTSTVNGGGRLLIFHNEPLAPPTFRITTVAVTAQGVELAWEAAGDAKYRVQRSATVASPTGFQDITGDLAETTYIDSAVPAGAAFYRVIIIR